MKIGFLAPINGFKEYLTIYIAIVKFLTLKNHTVVHPLKFNLAMINTWTKKERIAFFEEYYEKVSKSDLIIAECSYPCLSIGYELANIIKKGKEVIILKTKDSDKPIKNNTPLFQQKNIHIIEYNSFNFQDIIKEALSFNQNHKNKNFNILFTPELVAKT